jgi:hypothetical protein
MNPLDDDYERITVLPYYKSILIAGRCEDEGYKCACETICTGQGTGRCQGEEAEG